MAQMLYAAKGGNTNSDLYTVDPATGAMTSVGPIGFAVTGLAQDPTDGTLYGSTSNLSPLNPRSIITIDPATGAGTLVGPLGLGGSGHVAADIAFDSLGQLYGWVEGNDKLASIDKATGAGTIIGSFFISSFGDGMDFDNGGTLWACLKGGPVGSPTFPNIYTVDTATGVPTPQAVLSGGPFLDGPSVGAASFDQTDVLWAVFNDFPITHLVTIDVNTGDVTDVGAMLDGTDALVWVTPAAADNFSIALTPSSVTIPQGSSDTTALTTTITTGVAQSVALLAAGVPAGITVSFAANPIMSGGGTIVTVTVGPGVLSGTSYSITIVGIGSGGPTHSAVLTVTVPGANSSCGSATDLNRFGCFGDGTRTFTNAGLPTTPAIDDPLNTVYGLGWHWERQAWFKLTNTSTERSYIEFTLHNPEAVGIFFAAALYLDCPATEGPSPCLSLGSDRQVIWDSMAAGDTYPFVLATTLDPGQTVWLELAGDDDESSPAGWDGPLTLTWSVLQTTVIDGLDNNCAVAPASFTAATVAATGISYCRRGSDDFVAVNNAGVLQVWKYTGGVRTVYSIASFGTANGNVRNGTPFGPGVPNTAVILRTDGTDVWLIYYESAVVSNPYAGGTWQPWRVAVLRFNGSGFTVLGHDAAKTLNTSSSPIGLGALDAAASTAEPGVLHVFWNEGGGTTTGTRGERISYSKWSTSALVTQSDLAFNTGGTTTFPNASRLVSQYLLANNASGAIRAFYGRPLGAAGLGTTPYSNVVEMWDVTAGTANVIRSITLATLDPSFTALDQVSQRTFGASRRPTHPFGTEIIYLNVPVNGSASLLLTVNADGTSNFDYPDGSSAEGILSHYPYDIEDDGTNIYAGVSATGQLAIYSRTCPGWNFYTPNPDARFDTNTAQDMLVVSDTLYGHATDEHHTSQIGPLVWPILRDFYPCTVGAPHVCNGTAIFDGAPNHKAYS